MKPLRRFFALTFGLFASLGLAATLSSSADTSHHPSPAAKTSSAFVTNTDAHLQKPIVGNTVKVSSPAVVLGSGDEPRYRWFACETLPSQFTAEVSGCESIAGESSSELVLTDAEVGKHIVYSMAVGEGPESFGLATAAAVSPAPTLTVSPTGPNKTVRFAASRTPALNSKITVVRGSWPATPAAYTYSYAWLRCTDAVSATDAAPANCVEIPGAVSSSYVVTAKDTGFRLVSAVTATLDGVSSRVWTASTGVVYTTVKYYKGATVAAGTGSYPAVVGIPVKPNPGTWDGPPIFKYQWYVCTTKVAGSATLNKLCKIIAGATKETFTPTAAQNGKYLMVRLSGSTPLATTVVTTFSAGSVKVLDDPTNSKSVSVAKTSPIVGSKVTAVAGTWSGSPAPTRTYQWYSCETEDLAAGEEKPEDCEPIAGATATSLTITQDLFEKFIMVEERATNTAGTDSVFSASTLEVVSRPVFESEPVVLGLAEIGETLTAINGTGESSLEKAVTYQWYSCSTAMPAATAKPANCSAISGAADAELALSRIVEGLYLSVAVTLSNDVGSTVRFSATTSDFVVSAPLLESAALTPSPDPLVGTAFNAPAGLWRGAPAPSFSYQWLLCETVGPTSDSQPSGCQAIAGATAATFTPTHQEAGSYLRVRITASNSLGTVVVWSGTSTSVREKPNFIGAPVLSSEALNGTPISVSETSANGVPVPTRTIAWYQCKSQVLANTPTVPANAGCVALVGQIGASYTPNNSDLDRFIGALVTSTNTVGSVSVFTATSTVIRGEPQLLGSISAPGVTGVSPRVGVAINAPSSTWIGSPTPTKSIQWYSCAEELEASDQLSASCVEVDGATGTSFVPTVQEVDRYMMVRVVGANSLSSIYRYSPTGAIVQEAPNFLVDPVLVGGRLSGDELTFDELFTRGSPVPAATYAWYRCDTAIAAVQNSTTCPKIAGATSAKYRLTASDLDKFVSGSVTLTSSLGSVTKVTVSTLKIQGAPALVGSMPAPSSTPVRSEVAITMPTTVWTGSPAVARTFQWFACPAVILEASSTLDTQCQAISGATSASFTPTTAQVGKFLTVRTTATNAIATVVIHSPTTSVVNELPSFQGEASIGEAALVGDVVSSTVPAFRGFPQPEVSHSWFRCTVAVSAAALTLPNTCTSIAGATARQYTLDVADLDRFVLGAVTLTNSSGAVTRYTASTVMIQGVPKLTNVLGLPSSSLAGVTSPRIGTVQNAPTNNWAGSPKPTVQLQWVRCEDVSTASSSEPVPCEDIPGATAATYTPVLEDKTFALRVRITATNLLGSTTIWSGSTQKTQQPPAFAVEPTLNDFISVGQLIRVNAVSQNAFPVATESYLWYRCPSAVVAVSATLPASCVPIQNASISTYTIQNLDVDNYLVAKVTLTNEAGSASLFTVSSAKIITPPVFEQEAQVAGQAYVTGTLAINAFTVTAKPAATLSYQWYSCENRTFASYASPPSDCLVIAGATSSTYSPTDEHVNRFVSVLVTAKNIAGQVSSFSKTTVGILLPPRNTVAPVVTGSTVVGGVLSSDSGTWIPSSNVNFDYKWYACSKTVPVSDTISSTDCPVVAGATSSTFTLTAAQVGKFMVAGVTAKNFTINVTKFSAASEIIANVPVYVSGMNVTLPTGEGSIAGAPRVGYKIAAVDGSWTATPAPTFAYQWFVCRTPKTLADKSLSADCRNIIGATGRELLITKEIAVDYELVGQYLGVRITGSNKAGSDFAFSVTSAKTVTMPPQLVTDPVVSGYRYVDGVLTGTLGTFTGTPSTKETQAWWQCDAAIAAPTTIQPANCSKLTATTSTLKLTLAMKGKFVTSATTSSNDAGSLTVWAASPVAVTTGAINVVPPTIDANPIGLPKVGGELTANHGTWSGDPALTEASYTYQWYSCDTEIKTSSFELDLTAGCIRVGDAVNMTYVPIREDAGRFVLVSVTGTNSQGGSTVYSASTSKVNSAPENMVLPLLSGTAFVGTVESASAGTWIGVPDPAFAYQWLLCSSEQTVAPAQKPADCEAIAGATSATYKPLIGQVGQYLMAQVTATNIAGTAVVFSLTSEEIKSAPVNLVAPTVLISNGTAGLPVALQSTLSSSGGTWQGRPTPTLELQWFSCASAVVASADEPATEKDCKSVTERGAGVTYDPVASDRGRFIAVKVFATNVHATVTHWSASTTVVNMSPVADVAPTVSGVAFVQATVTAKNDTWTAFPEPTRTFQWLSCGEIEVASSCTVIPGAAAATYTIPSNLEGRSIMVRVTATNPFGLASNYSLASPKVTTGPVSTSAQIITGSIAYPPAAGAVLSVNDGTWAGDPRPALSYQWYRCSVLVAASAFELDPKCSVIDGATSNTYRLADEDPSSSLVAAITGENIWGVSTRYSASTPIVTEKVRLMTTPTLVGSARIGEEIGGDEGTWRGFPAPTTVYSWYSCTVATPATPVRIPASSGSGVLPPAACTKIQGATKNTFSVSNTHLGKMLIFMVTKSNVVDGVTTTINAYSQSSLPAAQPPVSLAKPVISSPGVVSGSNPKVGSVWTVSTALWADPQPVKTYQWYRCDTQIATGPTPITSLPAGCVAIDGAINSSYTVTAEDSGKFLSIEAIGSNAADTLRQWSNSTLSVLQVPVAIVSPSITGDRQRGKTLTLDPGVWTGNPTPVITYQWYSCKAAIATTSTTAQPSTNCSLISGETASTYVQSPAGSDDGKFITATVSGTSGTSEPTVYWVSVGANEATAQAPIASVLPSVYSKSGNAAVGEVFVIEDDKWVAAPAPVLTYKWFACDAPNLPAGSTLPSGCVQIAGQTSQSYTATIDLADSRKYLMGSVTATNLAGSATSYSKSYGAIIDKGIINTKPASISATSLVVPTSVGWTTGEWSSNSELKVSHKWLACPTALPVTYSYIPLDCEFVGTIVETDPAQPQPLSITAASELSGQYIALYERVDQKVDTTWRKVRERVTATTGQLLEAPALRSNDPGFVAPSVDKDMVVGYASTAKVGVWVPYLLGETAYTWRGSKVGTFSYQWFKCATNQLSYTTVGLPSGCSDLTNTAGKPTTNSSFTATEAELGAFIGVRITAVNATGAFSVWTNTSLAVTQEATNINAPTLGSANVVGDRLTLNGGLVSDWKGSPNPAVVVEWYTCGSPQLTAPATLPTNCTKFINASEAPSEGITIPADRWAGTQYLLVGVTATNTPWVTANKTSSVTLFSATSKRIVAKPYINTAAANPRPALSGFADVGSSLSVSTGSWLGTQPMTPSGRWFACDNVVATASTDPTVAPGCTLFKSATQNILLTHAQVGKYIVGQIAYTNEAGTSYQSTISSAKVLEPPTIVTPPEVSLVDAPSASGEIEVGHRIAYTSAVWDGAPAPAATVKFYECSSPVVAAQETLPGTCSLISGATGSQFTLGDAQAGKHIVAVSVANNTVNSGSKTAFSVSASLGPIYRAPYFDTAVAPSISVSPVHVGSTATFTRTSVKGFETPTSTYAWYICDNAVSAAANNIVPAGCSKVAGGDNAALVIPAEAAGKRLLGIQTASATWTSAKATRSTVTTAVVTASPYATSAPTITGDDFVGGSVKLSVDKGIWSSVPAITDLSKYSISWLLCDKATPAGPSNTICGATALATFTANAPQEFTPTAAHAGKFLVAKVTATAATNKNATDSGVFYSASIGPIRQAPTLPGSPTISGAGAPDVGKALSMTTTVPGGFPVNTPSYDWYICQTGAVGVPNSIPANCELQADFASKAFVIPASAAGKYVLGWVTATNTLGSVSKATEFTPVVKMAPVNTSAPSLAGADEVGGTITADPGAWNSNPAPTFTYQWYSCDAASSTVSSGCSAVAGSTASTFSPTEAQAGKYILANVTATTSVWAGNALAVKASSTFGPIRMPATVKTAPQITGAAHVGEALTLAFAQNAVIGYPKPTFEYDWYACDAAVSQLTNTLPADCSIVAGYTSKPLTVGSAIAGKFVTAVLTAENYQTIAKTLPSTAAVTATLSNTSLPELSGDIFVGGSSLTVSAGTWQSTPVVNPATDITYAFFTCPTSTWSAVDCTSLSAANSKVSTLTLATNMQGKFIVARVTANVAVNKNGLGLATATSNAIGPIEAPPTFSATPTTSGTFHVGSDITATSAGELGLPAPSKTFIWFLCDSPVAANLSTMPAGCTPADVAINLNAKLTLPAAAAGKYAAVLVKLENSRGVLFASSSASTLVTMTPEISTAPAIGGDDIFASGKSITVSQGVWTTAPSNVTKSFSYSWYACPTSSSPIANCAYLADTATASIATTEAMVDKFVVAKVTISVAVNKSGAGTAFAYSNASNRIRKAAVFTGTPAISGSLHIGETVTASTGNPSGVPAPSVTYAWYVCTSPVATAVTSAPTGCVLNTSSTGNTFVVPMNAAGSYILVLARAASDSDLASVTKSSTATLAVSSPPVIGATIPSVTGSPVLGAAALAATNGTWTWKPTTATATYSYKWFTCPSTLNFAGGAELPAGCSQIANQTAGSLILTTSQLGFKIMAEVTASVKTNMPTPSRTSHYTAVTAVVASKPAAGTTAPTISYTTLTAGSILKANLGTWTGSPAPTLAYTWYTCPANTTQPTNKLAPATCTALTAKGDLTVLSTYKGLKLLLLVTATNSAGTATNIATLLAIP